MKAIFLIISFLFSSLLIAQNQSLFEEGNALYNEGKYAEAIDKYMAILESEKHSADLYFNLGNAHYKLNNIAPSIYYYEKALQLEPNDKDINNNIAFARNMTIDAIDVIPDTGFSRLLKGITNTFSFDNWARVSIALVFCFVLLFLVYYFAFSTLIKRLTFISSLVSLFLVCVTLAFAFYKFNLDKKDNPAIIFTQEAKVKSDPNVRSDEVFRLHEGTKVQVVNSYNNWKKIELSDGKTGWIVSEDIRLLNEF
ncbi:tetratricopeptide repeat protein [Seonamhaeicola aphaedonensis]|uniref:SH3 domain-containing protein n=1 Tax=Seonamhaeicola aphaedonensis TaxID=1461338 RepID=A0A3D9HGY8_9FLAO|nr:tetratricopeptide repeat protein [Seonamhaeicola aphaedonensis]RED48757.1 SH3 domain-containing protein [Seonamhaeicola aphaedonensis]